MRRRHRGGRRQGGTRPRFGGWNPLKIVAGVAGVAIGGVIAVGLAGLMMLVLTAIGFATAGVSWLLTYGWIIAAFLIYRAIRRRQSSREYAYDYDDDDWREQEDEREREYQQRVQQLQNCAEGRPDTRPADETRRNTGTAVIAVLSGVALALAANVGIQGLQLPPLAHTLLPPVAGGAVGLGVFAALKRWVMSPIDEETPPAREVRRQVKRIRRKARELRSEAERAGAVYNGLDTKSELLAADASELAERLFMLRGVARDVRREFGNPARPDGVPHESPDPQVQGAVQKAQQAQKRLDELLSRNRSAQHRCLAQIERIEDLLDMARLEIACPEDSAPADTGREELVQEVETELEAARRAIEEVQQQSELA